MSIDRILLLRVSSTIDKDVDHPQFIDPSLPLKHIQAGLDRMSGVQTTLLDGWLYPMSVEDLLAYTARIHPDLVIVSSSSYDIQVSNAYAAAVRVARPETIVVGIGQGHYIHRDLEAEPLAHYDAVLLGEPEAEVFRLLERIRREGTHNDAWRAHYRTLFQRGHRFIIHDPDALPFPSYTLREIASYRSLYPVPLPGRAVWGFLIATRGCPHGCVFCSEVMRSSAGRTLRSRSPGRVVDEMEHLAAQGVTVCSFQDDSFSAPRRVVRQLLAEMIRRGSKMPWMARVRVDEVDRDLLARMKEAGCFLLAYGVESGSQRVIEQMQKQRRPEPWADLCRRVFRWTHEVGISTNAFFVIGNPAETRSEIEATLQLAMELNADTIQVHFFTPYPGSIAWKQLKDRFVGVDPRRMYHYARPLFSLAEVSVDDLIALRRTFYRRYIFRWRFAWRHARRYARFYRDNPDVLRDMLGIRKVM